MDAVKFIEERNRMCKSVGDACTGCPAFNVCEDNLCCCAVDIESTMDATAQVAIVEGVVRCRECKHHYWEQEPCHGKSVHYCKLPHMIGVEVFKEFFCYYGERKDGDRNG